MKKILKILMVILPILAGSLFGDNLEESFIQANQAYRAGEFDKAIELYRNIQSQGYESADLYFNLGNCFFRLNQIGQAILHYEKAKRLDPNNSDINYNIEIANLRIVDRIELPPRFFFFDWWDSVKWFYSITQLTYLILVLFIFSLVLIVLYLFSKKEKLKSFFLTFSGISGFLLLFWIYIFILRINEFQNRQQAIILAPSVTVMSAPDENSTDVFILHEGVKVFLDEESEDWVKINLADGKSGWIKNNILGII